MTSTCGTSRSRQYTFNVLCSLPPSKSSDTRAVDSHRVILASLHVCVPEGTTLEQWEQTERYLQHCFSAYGISHVTISPEIQRDAQSNTEVSEDGGSSGVGCRHPSENEFGCSVSDLRKRKTGQV